MKFTKMQGAGNDYIYINCLEEAPPENPSELSKKLSDRHFGIGSDGIILILPSAVANIKMEIYNADGSRARMCGNGIRCVGKFAFERALYNDSEISVETGSGIKKLSLNVENEKVKSVRVNMGMPIFRPADIPMNFYGDSFIDMPIEILGKKFCATALSMGNPHCVIFLETLEGLDLPVYGSVIEKHSLFPERANVEFAEIISDGLIKVRVWERGSGETMACGTGACAVLAAAFVSGRSGNKAKILLTGGELLIEYEESTGEIFMTGGAETVFDGVI